MQADELKGKYEVDYKTRKQTIFRTIKNQDNPFVMMDRRPIENPDLSWKAKGILAYLLSRPDNWIVRIGDLVKRSPDGVYAIRGAIKELEQAGHVSRKEVRDPKTKQFIRYELEVYELPFTSKPLRGFPQADNPQADNLTINDTDCNDTELNNTSANAESLSIENQIAIGVKEVTLIQEREEFERKAKDRANLIDFQCPGAGSLAYAFMVARNILIPESGVKRQRVAAQEMLELGVKPEHVAEATNQLKAQRDRNGKPLTITDLFAIKKTAISLANMVTDFITTLDGTALEQYA